MKSRELGVTIEKKTILNLGPCPPRRTTRMPLSRCVSCRPRLDKFESFGPVTGDSQDFDTWLENCFMNRNVTYSSISCIVYVRVLF